MPLMCESRGWHSETEPDDTVRNIYLGERGPVVWRLTYNMTGCGCVSSRAVCQACFDHVTRPTRQASRTRCLECNSTNVGTVLDQVASLNRIVSE